MASLEELIELLHESEEAAIEEESHLCPTDGSRLVEGPDGEMYCRYHPFHTPG